MRTMDLSTREELSGMDIDTRASRILIVTRNLPPLTGGMERLNWHLADELGRKFAVRLCGPHGSRELSPDDAPVLYTFASRPLRRFIIESLAVTLRAAWRFRPALVVAGSGVTAPHAWLASRLTGARMLVYLHGLDLVADHPLYRTLFIPSIRRTDLALVNSRNTAGLAQAAGIARERIEILHPGARIPSALDHHASDAFRHMIDAGDRSILLSVGRLTARKGLLEFVRQALPNILEAKPNLLLVVIGGEASEKLGAHNHGQGEAIRQEAGRLGLGDHLRLLGQVDEITLEHAYRASQAHIFPVLDLPGDVEGFGMVAVEAAAHGLPTIAFAVGGVPDAVAHDVSGLLVPEGNYSGLAKAVINLLDGRHLGITPASCREFAAAFSWDAFGQRARQICAELIKKGG